MPEHKQCRVEAKPSQRIALCAIAEIARDRMSRSSKLGAYLVLPACLERELYKAETASPAKHAVIGKSFVSSSRSLLNNADPVFAGCRQP